MFISKDAQYSDRSFSIAEFFFVRFSVFELWSILYITVGKSVPTGIERGKLCEPDSDANQFRLGSSLPWACLGYKFWGGLIYA